MPNQIEIDAYYHLKKRNQIMSMTMITLKIYLKLYLTKNERLTK